MNENILKPEVQTYLKDNLNRNVRDFSLMKSPFSGISSAELAQQLKGLQIAKAKFPIYFETENIYYPPSINLEQASSWATSKYKANIVNGKSIIDLTAGMGIDSLGFAQKFESVTSLERNFSLVEICKHNYQVLNQLNINYVSSDFETYFKDNPSLNWDVIYLDPSRRIESQRKVVLEDLEPNILDWIDIYLQKAETVLIKLSPLLDLKSTIEKIPQIQEIHIVALKNEVKELLLICKNKLDGNPKIKAVNLESDQPDFEFNWQDEFDSKSIFSSPKKYIYEPNSSILKSGAFKLLGERFQLEKLHVNTHIYTSDILVNSFPGKVFEVIEEIHNPKKSIKNQAFHVVSKNFPMTVDLIRKKYQLKESETQTLFFLQSIENKHILRCKRIL